MKFTLSNHIIGKTYDLTQENLNRAIETAVSWHEEARRVLKDKKELAERVSNLQTEAAMWQEAATKSAIELAELLTYSVGIKEANSRLRSALKCANELISEFNSYSTGCSCLAEEDVAELFGKYTEALEAAEARQACCQHDKPTEPCPVHKFGEALLASAQSQQVSQEKCPTCQGKGSPVGCRTCYAVAAYPCEGEQTEHVTLEVEALARALQTLGWVQMSSGIAGDGNIDPVKSHIANRVRTGKFYNWLEHNLPSWRTLLKHGEADWGGDKPEVTVSATAHDPDHFTNRCKGCGERLPKDGPCERTSTASEGEK